MTENKPVLIMDDEKNLRIFFREFCRSKILMLLLLDLRKKAASYCFSIGNYNNDHPI